MSTGRWLLLQRTRALPTLKDNQPSGSNKQEIYVPLVHRPPWSMEGYSIYFPKSHHQFHTGSLMQGSTLISHQDNPSEPPATQEPLPHPNLNDQPALLPDDETAPTPTTDKGKGHAQIDLVIDGGYYDNDNKGIIVDRGNLGCEKLAGKKTIAALIFWWDLDNILLGYEHYELNSNDITKWYQQQEVHKDRLVVLQLKNCLHIKLDHEHHHSEQSFSHEEQSSEQANAAIVHQCQIERMQQEIQLKQAETSSHKEKKETLALELELAKLHQGTSDAGGGF
ncbi:hypothetical protein BS17DRAFT_765147 [Gyrodon lividus]|nr:hypothetical protein BS17DRAFT_765147 [Gyrodon lividus]